MNYTVFGYAITAACLIYLFAAIFTKLTLIQKNIHLNKIYKLNEKAYMYLYVALLSFAYAFGLGLFDINNFFHNIPIIGVYTFVTIGSAKYSVKFFAELNEIRKAKAEEKKKDLVKENLSIQEDLRLQAAKLKAEAEAKAKEKEEQALASS